jgi:purine nucleoside permease
MRWMKIWAAACAAHMLALISPALAETPAAEKPIEVKVIVVANFEPGADTGDAPGEFQLWAEREQLTEAIPFKGGLHPLMRNKEGLYGIVWGATGRMFGSASEQLAAMVLDPRFDFSKTYWLLTGISGGDPELAPVGSAAWARWVINGDPMREFDDREIPADWPYGLFAIGASKPNELPNDPNSFGAITDPAHLSMALPLNQGLAYWAYGMTKIVKIPDSAIMKKERKAWAGFPNAQKPPVVLMGETLGALRYWHGEKRTQWARDWVKLWTGGKGVFAMSNMESQTIAGGLYSLSKAGLVDMDRVMVLRTASNFTMPPPDVSATKSVGEEEAGQLGAYEANYVVGIPVVRELMKNWTKYRDAIPSAPIPAGPAQ